MNETNFHPCDFSDLEKIAEARSDLDFIEKPEVEGARDYLLEYNQKLKEGLQSLEYYDDIIKKTNQLKDEAKTSFSIHEREEPGEKRKNALSILTFYTYEDKHHTLGSRLGLKSPETKSRWVVDYEEVNRFSQEEKPCRCFSDLQYGFTDKGNKYYFLELSHNRETGDGLLSFTFDQKGNLTPESYEQLDIPPSQYLTDDPSKMADWLTHGLHMSISKGINSEQKYLAEMPWMIKRLTEKMCQVPKELEEEIGSHRKLYAGLDIIQELDYR
jgi:hypothetical protein